MKRISDEHLRNLEQIQAERASVLLSKQQAQNETLELKAAREGLQAQIASNRAAAEALEQREKQVLELKRELELHKGEYDADRARVEARARVLERDRAEIEARTQAVEDLTQKLDARERRLEVREQETCAREADLDAQMTNVARQMADGDQRLKELAEKERDSAALSQSAQRAGVELATREQDLVNRESALEASRLELAALRKEHQEVARRSEHKQHELLRDQTRAFEEQARRVEQSLLEKTRGLEKRETELSQKQHALEAYSDGLKEQVAWLEAEQAERDVKRQELNAFQARMEDEAASVSQARKALQQREVELAKRQAGLDFAVQRLREREARHSAQRDKDRRAASKMVDRLERCAQDLGVQNQRGQTADAGPGFAAAAPKEEVILVTQPSQSVAPPVSAEALLQELNVLRRRQDADWKHDLDDLDKAQKAMERRLQEQALDMADRQRKELLKAQEELVIIQEKGQKHILEKLQDVITLAETQRGNKAGSAAPLEPLTSSEQAVKLQAMLEEQREMLFSQLAAERQLLEERQMKEREILETERLELERRAEQERESIEQERASLLKRDEAIVENLSASVVGVAESNSVSSESTRAKNDATGDFANSARSDQLVHQALKELAREKEQFQEEIAARKAQHEADRRAMEEERKRMELELDRHRNEMEAKLEQKQSILTAKWEEFSLQMRNSPAASQAENGQKSSDDSPTTQARPTAATEPPPSPHVAVSTPAPKAESDSKRKISKLPTSPVLELQSLTPLLVARARAQREELAQAIIRKEMEHEHELEQRDIMTFSISRASSGCTTFSKRCFCSSKCIKSFVLVIKSLNRSSKLASRAARTSRFASSA